MTTHTWGTAGTISGLANNQQGNVISQNLATMVQGGAAPTTVTTGFSSLAGIWWHDTTNNQVKVRDQADTAWILVGSVDETNKLFTAAASGIAAIQGAVKNLKVSTVTGAVAITADEIVLETSGNTYAVARNVAVTANPASSGANGLDTGTFATNTWYAVWIITNGSTVASLLSTSATAPTMPSGYTYKARVGWVRSNATPALYPVQQVDRRAQYIVDGTILTSLRKIKSAGSSVGSISTPTYVAQSVSTFVPPTAGVIRLVVGASGGTSRQFMLAPNANYGAANSLSNPPPINGGGLDLYLTTDMVLESSNLYFTGEANTFIACLGWEDNL